MLGIPERDTYQYHFTTDRVGRRSHHLVSVERDLPMFTLSDDPSCLLSFMD